MMLSNIFDIVPILILVILFGIVPTDVGAIASVIQWVLAILGTLYGILFIRRKYLILLDEMRNKARMKEIEQIVSIIDTMSDERLLNSEEVQRLVSLLKEELKRRIDDINN